METSAHHHGSFTVSLDKITWKASGASAPSERALWLHVQLVNPVENATTSTIWFTNEEENTLTPLVELSAHGNSVSGALKYVQASKAIPLTVDALAFLVQTQVVVSLYGGTTRVPTSDTLLGEQRLSLLDALMNESVERVVEFTHTTTTEEKPAHEDHEAFFVHVRVFCDVDLVEFAHGARVLQLHAVEITHLPPEWTPQLTDDHDADAFCQSTERNTALYELELRLPEFHHETKALTTRSVVWSNGKLSYAYDRSKPTEANALTDHWLVRFPIKPVLKLYPKQAIDQLTAYLQVEKHMKGTIKRLAPEPGKPTTTDVTTAPFQLHVGSLASPGATKATCKARLIKANPLTREAIEQEISGTSAGDEKKRLQAIVADYETLVHQPAKAVSASMKKHSTTLSVAIEIFKTPLVPLPPSSPSSTASKLSIEELIPSRNLVEERDQTQDAASELRSEVRRVMLTLLHEYDGFFGAGGTLSKEEKRTKLIYRLNTQGIYHDFKEKLKKRIIPIIRDRFARPETPKDDDQLTINERKKQYFGKLYGFLMEEIHTTLQETFLSDGEALEKTFVASNEPSAQEIQAILRELWLKALENEANNDLHKSERMHLDRIAYAEQLHATYGVGVGLNELVTTYSDYATFCLHQHAVEQAGGALRQCLALDATALSPLVTLVALLCDQQDFGQVEPLVTHAIDLSLKNKTASEALVLSHGLLAFYYACSGRDRTGNLVLYELLKAQTVLRQRTDRSEACLSSVWLVLADMTQELRLMTITRICLQQAAHFRRPRDVFTLSERVLWRILDAITSQDESETIRLLHHALELDPEHSLAWFLLGKTHVQETINTAIECFDKALRHQETLSQRNRLELFLQYGLALLQTSQFLMAKQIFLQACAEFPIASNWLGVGIACLRLEEFASAHMALAEANRLDPSNEEVWGYLALYALSAGLTSTQEQEAKRCVDMALRYELRNPVLLRELSNGFVAIDRLEEAERLLRRSLVYQDSSLTRKTLADVLAAQNCAEDALAQYKSSLNESDDVQERMVLLEKCAQLLVTLGRPDEAQQYRHMAQQFQSTETEPAAEE